jgi:hypothetical protein
MLDDTLPDFDMLVRERLVMVEWRGDFIYASAIDADLRDGILARISHRAAIYSNVFSRGEQLTS